MDSEFVDKYLSGGRQGAVPPASPAAEGAPVSADAAPERRTEPADLAAATPAMTWPSEPTEPQGPAEPPRAADTGQRPIAAPGPEPEAAPEDPGGPAPSVEEQIASGMYRPAMPPRRAPEPASENETTDVVRAVRDAPPGNGRPALAQPHSAPPARRPNFSAVPANQPASWQPSAGAPATLDYQIRTDDLVKTRRQAPELGWRKAVYAGSFHTVNLGASEFEKRLIEQKALISSNIPGNYQIAVLSIKGGVGKTRTVAGVGSVFGEYRTEPVIAFDANPCYGNLGRLIDPRATASIREWLADDGLRTYPKARSHTGKNKQGLEVLAGNQNVANPLYMDAEVFTAALQRVQLFYQLSLIDCGPMIDHPVTPGVLAAASALVIVSSMQAEHVDKAGQTIEWLATRGAHDLLRRTVVVLNDAFDSQTKQFVTHVTERVAPHVQSVKVIPFDKHLRDAVTLDFEALRPRTQLAYIDLAAELATGFSSGHTPVPVATPSVSSPAVTARGQAGALGAAGSLASVAAPVGELGPGQASAGRR